MPAWLSDIFAISDQFMPHGHCYFWLPGLLWLHVVSDSLIGIAYLCISLLLYLLVRRIKLPFSPVFIAFGLFIGLCGVTHFMAIWTVWNPDYWADGLVKAATAAASVATAVALFYVRPQVEEMVHAARLSQERKLQLESANAELKTLYKKLQEASDIRTQFFANISHELRTPLSLIAGPTELLLEEATLSSEQRSQLNTIRRSSKMLLKQVNDLLAVAQMEEQAVRVQYTNFDAAELLRQVAAQFALVATEKHITFQLQAPARLCIDADLDQFERILVNLIANALKFTPRDGHVEVVLARAANRLELEVRDTGMGIDEDQHGVIFERFRQADGSATRKFGGTGLGLALVKEFVEAHHGQVRVVSALGKGASFFVVLPLKAPAGVAVNASVEQHHSVSQKVFEGTLEELHEPAAAAAGAHSTPASRETKPQILVVEDNADMQGFIVQTLQQQYEVLTAHNGKVALEMLSALRPDLVLTDLMMPELSGLQLLEQIRLREALNNVPVILLTARSEEALRVQLLSSGAQDYLSKPCHPLELKARVNIWVTTKLAADSLRKELAVGGNRIDEMAKTLSAQHGQLRLALETAEVARAQAERAALTRTNFLAAMSHEVRTPLTVIAMNATYLMGADATLPAAVQKHAESIARSAQHLSDLTEGVLEFARAQNGLLIPKLEAVAVSPLLAEVYDLVVRRTSSANQCVLEPPDGDLPKLVTDPKLLRVALVNLLNGALKHYGERTLTLQLILANNELIFTVTIPELAMTEQELGQLFTPFEQLEPVRHRGLVGAGLELALVKEIIAVLGGRIEAHVQRAGLLLRMHHPLRQE